MSEALSVPTRQRDVMLRELTTEVTAEFTTADEAFLSDSGISAGYTAEVRSFISTSYDISTGEIGGPNGFEGGAIDGGGFDGGGIGDDSGGE